MFILQISLEQINVSFMSSLGFSVIKHELKCLWKEKKREAKGLNVRRCKRNMNLKSFKEKTYPCVFVGLRLIDAIQYMEYKCVLGFFRLSSCFPLLAPPI